MDEQRNPNPEVEGILDTESRNGESGEGEGGISQIPTAFRAKRVQFDLTLSQGFNDPFAHVVVYEDPDDCVCILAYRWRPYELVASWELQPDETMIEFLEVLHELTS